MIREMVCPDQGLADLLGTPRWFSTVATARVPSRSSV